MWSGGGRGLCTPNVAARRICKTPPTTWGASPTRLSSRRPHRLAIPARNEILVPTTAIIRNDRQQTRVGAEVQGNRGETALRSIIFGRSRDRDRLHRALTPRAPTNPRTIQLARGLLSDPQIRGETSVSRPRLADRGPIPGFRLPFNREIRQLIDLRLRLRQHIAPELGKVLEALPSGTPSFRRSSSTFILYTRFCRLMIRHL